MTLPPRKDSMAAGPPLWLVAVTGSMGCGKSGVTAMLAAKGARAMDSDRLARQLLEPEASGWRQVVEHFGTAILEGGEGALARRPVDRRALGERVFANPEERAALEAILHPLIYRQQAETLARWQEEGQTTIIVAEVPLLFETGGAARYDLTVTVACGRQQWARLQARTGMTDATKRAVMAQQMTEAEKKQRAHRVVDNSGPLEATKKQVDTLWQEIITLARTAQKRAWPQDWHPFLTKVDSFFSRK